MKKKPTQLILAAGTIGLLSTGVNSQAAGLFTGAGTNNKWETAANWDDGQIPGNSGNVTFNIYGNNTALFDAATWSALSSNGLLTGGATGEYRGAQRFFMGENNSGGNNGTQTLTFDHGGTNLVNVTQVASGGIATRTGKNSILNIQSGVLNMGSNAFSIGSQGNGSLNVSGGEMIFGRTGLVVGGGTGTGSITITGGSFTTRSSLTLGGAGMFSVAGSGASVIGLGNAGTDGNGSWSQASGSILSMMVDSSVTKISLADGSSAGTPTATFDAGSILDLGFLGSAIHPEGGSWTLMEVENGIITDNGLVLDAADIAAGWSYTVDNSGPNGLLIATFIPEPSTALLGLSSLGLLLVRRRR